MIKRTIGLPPPPQTTTLAPPPSSNFCLGGLDGTLFPAACHLAEHCHVEMWIMRTGIPVAPPCSCWALTARQSDKKLRPPRPPPKTRHWRLFLHITQHEKPKDPQRGLISQRCSQTEMKNTNQPSSTAWQRAIGSPTATLVMLCMRFRLDGVETREDINRSEVVAANILLLIIRLLKGGFYGFQWMQVLKTVSHCPGEITSYAVTSQPPQ